MVWAGNFTPAHTTAVRAEPNSLIASTTPAFRASESCSPIDGAGGGSQSVKGGACASGEPSGEQTTWNEMPQDEENPESQTQIAEMPEVTVMCQLDARFRASGRQQVCNCAFCQESVNVGCV